MTWSRSEGLLILLALNVKSLKITRGIFELRINLDFDLFRWGFNGFLTTMLCAWLPMQLSSLFFVYYCFSYWASKHHEIKSSNFFRFKNFETFTQNISKRLNLYFEIFLNA